MRIDNKSVGGGDRLAIEGRSDFDFGFIGARLDIVRIKDNRPLPVAADGGGFGFATDRDFDGRTGRAGAGNRDAIRIIGAIYNVVLGLGALGDLDGLIGAGCLAAPAAARGGGRTAARDLVDDNRATDDRRTGGQRACADTRAKSRNAAQNGSREHARFYVIAGADHFLIAGKLDLGLSHEEERVIGAPFAKRVLRHVIGIKHTVIERDEIGTHHLTIGREEKLVLRGPIGREEPLDHDDPTIDQNNLERLPLSTIGQDHTRIEIKGNIIAGTDNNRRTNLSTHRATLDIARKIANNEFNR